MITHTVIYPVSATILYKMTSNVRADFHWLIEIKIHEWDTWTQNFIRFHFQDKKIFQFQQISTSRKVATVWKNDFKIITSHNLNCLRIGQTLTELKFHEHKYKETSLSEAALLNYT